MCKHTNKPWFVDPTGDIHELFIGTREESIAEAFLDVGEEEAAANARLIAAAPIGYVLAKEVINESSPLDPDDPEGPIVLPMKIYDIAVAILVKYKEVVRDVY